MLTRHHILPALLALALLSGPLAAMAETPAKTYTRTIDKNEVVTPSTRVTVENLAGHVKVTQGGKQLVVHANVVAGGADMAAAKALANTIKLAVNRDGDQLTVHVDYPVNTYDSYRYIPAKGSHDSDNAVHFLGFTFHTSNSSSSLEYQGRQVSVYRGRDEGVPLHVDLAVTLPAASHADIDNHVGLIEARNLRNTLTLRSDSGDIIADHIDGDLHTRSGSGDATLTSVHGTLATRTGSGDVKVGHVEGNATLHTGSGDIYAKDLKGDELALQAGSGDIHVDGASGALQLHTGSGDIRLKGLGSVSRLRAECGSGDIHVHGNLAGVQSFDMQTGSGDVTLVSAQPPAVRLDIDGSDIKVDWPALHDSRKSRRHFSGKIGAATGQGRISTGSGDVTLTQ